MKEESTDFSAALWPGGLCLCRALLWSGGSDAKTSREYGRFSFDEWSEHLLSGYKIFAAESHRVLINRSWAVELLQST